MQHRHAFLALAFLGALAGAAPALADAGKMLPLREGPRSSIQAYGQQNPQCREWTNGCVLCTAGTDGHSQCSLPGISCQPAGITCKRKAP